MKATKALGLATFLSFTISVVLLFTANPQALEEVKTLSITGYNVHGLSEQHRVMFMNYVVPGLLMALFGLSLSKEYKKWTEGKVGCYLLTLSGLFWASLALNPFNPTSEETFLGYLFYLQPCFAWAAGAIALLLIGLDKSVQIGSRNMKWFTLALAAVMLSSIMYLLFQLNQYSGVVSAVGWVVYFSWFALISVQKSHQPTKRILNPR